MDIIIQIILGKMDNDKSWSRGQKKALKLDIYNSLKWPRISKPIAVS